MLTTYYCVTRPRSMRRMIDQLKRQQLALKSNDEAILKEQYWIVQDALKHRQHTQANTQRDFYIAIQTSGANLKSSSPEQIEDEAKED